VDRVFLDANVLFSAAYRAETSLHRLWQLDDVTLVTSSYALEEASRNLESPEQLQRMRRLQDAIAIGLPSGDEPRLPAGVDLPEDDQPILAAAIAMRASHLLSGDLRAFGRYFGQRLGGVLVLRPADFLRERR
jgi:predicted nucleic acid-binding protein